jgi:hypothetical protein
MENKFQNPQIFHQRERFSPERSTLEEYNRVLFGKLLNIWFIDAPNPRKLFVFSEQFLATGAGVAPPIENKILLYFQEGYNICLSKYAHFL